MEIAEYDQVDALGVLHLNLLALGFALTPEYAAALRRLDPRPFRYFALYAQGGGTVAGQVGVFRLPVVSSAGAGEVGGVWAVSTHPGCARRGIATRLLEEAHDRMRRAGLRFSTLGTRRSGVAHPLYRRLGYEDVWSPAGALGGPDVLAQSTNLRAERAGREQLVLADRLFEQIADGSLGFARRHIPFFPALEERGKLGAHDLWFLWQGDDPAGYAIAGASPRLLTVDNLLLFAWADPAAAVAAIAQAAQARYARVRLDRTADAERLRQAGYRTAACDWEVFMVKPLAADASVADFRRLYGVDDGRFLASYLDVT
jgi:GNAT superfamily N-acetyltransferase